MSSRLHDLWTAERSQGLRRLRGSRLSGVVPVRQELVDRLLGRRRPGVLDDVHIRLLAGSRVRVSAVVSVFGFRKHVDAVLQWPAAVNFREPTVRLVFVERSPLVAAASLAGPLLGRLPGGISVSDGAVTIDLSTLMDKLGASDLLPHLRSLTLDGADGVLWLNLEIEVGEGQVVTSGEFAARSTRTPVPAAGLNTAELPGLFRGTRLAILLRAHESLVADAANAGLTGSDGEQPSLRPGAGTSVAPFVSPLEIRLEPETLIVRTELRVDGVAEKS